ncbi:transcriptional regulator, IclR family [Ammonifex degensii KC4]|uniref:Glycerol operon regulatory protein n=1 Tax=Ammonifex degensii (strain DSM 10501 / KC4) TaxID=429009 RepID=C9R9G0_AMMDK|nr:transcriptional regulator, IclR family [Ammonifex degensii KC4]
MKTKKKREQAYAVHSVERALAILEALGTNPGGLGVTRLSKELGLHKSTVHRLLATLVRYGFVEQDESTECYRLGMRFVSLGLNYLHQLDFRREVLPYLKELAELTGETTQMGVLEGDEVFFLERCQSSEAITVNLGLKAPAYCSAEGKVLLAYLSPERLREYLKRQELKPYTINTLSNPEQLLLHLEKIRAQGYAVSAEELADGLRGVAAPIFDVKGRVVAAIGVAGPASRLTLERINRLVNILRETCYVISLRLGYRPATHQEEALSAPLKDVLLRSGG